MIRSQWTFGRIRHRSMHSLVCSSPLLGCSDRKCSPTRTLKESLHRPLPTGSSRRLRAPYLLRFDTSNLSSSSCWADLWTCTPKSPQDTESPVSQTNANPGVADIFGPGGMNVPGQDNRTRCTRLHSSKSNTCPRRSLLAQTPSTRGGISAPDHRSSFSLLPLASVVTFAVCQYSA